MKIAYKILLLFLIATNYTFGDPISLLEYYYKISFPYPGCQDEKLTLASLPLEVFLSPGDFPQLPLRYTLLDDSAWYFLQVDETTFKAELNIKKLKLPSLQGRDVVWDIEKKKIKLFPMINNIKYGGIGDKIELDLFFKPSIDSSSINFRAEIIGIRLLNREKNLTVFYWLPEKEYTSSFNGMKKLYRLSLAERFLVDIAKDKIIIFHGDLRPRIDLFKIKNMVKKYLSILFSNFKMIPNWVRFYKKDSIVIVDKVGELHLISSDYFHSQYHLRIKRIVKDLVDNELWFINDDKRLIHFDPEKGYTDLSLYLFKELYPLCKYSVDFKIRDKVFLCKADKEAPKIFVLNILKEKGRLETERILDKGYIPYHVSLIKDNLYISQKEGLIRFDLTNEYKKEIVSKLCKGRFFVDKAQRRIVCCNENSIVIMRTFNNKWRLEKKFYNSDISTYSFPYIIDDKFIVIIGNEFIWKIEL